MVILMIGRCQNLLLFLIRFGAPLDALISHRFVLDHIPIAHLAHLAHLFLLMGALSRLLEPGVDCLLRLVCLAGDTLVGDVL
jgi:hypothetical protein